MTDRFGGAAARLSSAVSMLLGWRPDEFWNATPAEIALAFTSIQPSADSPDPEVIEALRGRFPDQ